MGSVCTAEEELIQHESFEISDIKYIMDNDQKLQQECKCVAPAIGPIRIFGGNRLFF